MKRRDIRRTALARADIAGISQSIAEYRGSIDAALKWLIDLESKFEKIAAAPGMGTSQTEIEPGLRIFFRTRADGVTIMRVIHGARDYSAGLPSS